MIAPRNDVGTIAVIGLAGRFPGAQTIEQFWDNLREGVDVTTFPTDEEFRCRGVPQAILDNQDYVKATLPIADADKFDAAFFDMSPAEAELVDPQQRVFLECCWHALEDAGYPPASAPMATGVFGSTSVASYQFHNLSTHPLLRYSRYGLDFGSLQTLFGNAPDFLATRVSYRLNLSGPSATVQTACSSSLVAVHQACQSLLNEECDLALAGGVSIRVPQHVGYFYQEGSILSPDGRCRAFDDAAAGTVFGSGVGVVVLKRLSEALTDRDHIYAIIRGSAVNNDAATKAGFTAPSVGPQSQVIAEALDMAGVTADTISYVEAHGTGTRLGDPIEIAALTRAFRIHTDRTGYCAIGSVKTNVGHLDVAAGIAGLIKTILALHHGVIPASLNYVKPNAEIEFDATPFYVNTRTTSWRSDGLRRAGVTSLGVGGTNVHVVLESAPRIAPASRGMHPPRPVHLLTLSAKSPAALERAATDLAEFLARRPEASLGDVALTLHKGRKLLPCRMAMLASELDEARIGLLARRTDQLWSGVADPAGPAVVFGFPGQGSQYVAMGADAYANEPVFREELDRCARLLAPHIGLDLREVIFPGEATESAASRLRQTAMAQPALFSVGYALARLWQSWGVEPAAGIGHSIGEYVAACLSGVFTLEDALMVVAERGRLMQGVPRGAMLLVHLPENQLRDCLQPFRELSIAAVNDPGSAVVAGPCDAVEDFEQSMHGTDVACHWLETSHAFHSAMMDPVLERFHDAVSRAHLGSPAMPFVSSATGDWIRKEDAVTPAYWVRQLRQPVRFSEGIRSALGIPRSLLLEVGPGRTLSTLAQRQVPDAKTRPLLTSLPHPKSSQRDLTVLHASLGKLWLRGARINWERYHEGESCGRISMPTYPFERTRHWFEPEGDGLPASVEDGKRSEACVDDSQHPELATNYATAAIGVESQLADLFRSVLHIDAINVHDNLFDLGIDSVMAVQVAMRSTAAGLPLSPKQLFDNRTIAALAAEVTRLQQQQREEADLVGLVPLTPYQAWLLSHERKRAEKWARVIVLCTTPRVDAQRVQATLDTLLRQHDVFRISYTTSGGFWRQELAAVAGTSPGVSVRPLPDSNSGIVRSAVEELIVECQSRLSLEDGQLCQAGLLQGGTGCPDRLVIVLHQLIADDVSLGILLTEFEALYRQSGRGNLASLPRTMPFTAWSVSSGEHSRATSPLPLPDQTSRFTCRTALWNAPDLVDRLRSSCQRVRIDARDVLLVALLQALDCAVGISVGGHRVRIPVCLREQTAAGQDLSWSVGPFLQLNSLQLDLTSRDDPLELLLMVKETARTVRDEPSIDGPDSMDGILFRYSEVRSCPDEANFVPDAAMTDIPVATLALGYPLELWLSVSDLGLQSTWFFDIEHYPAPVAERIVDSMLLRLEDLLERCERSDRVLYSPTDFRDVELDRSDLDSLLRELGVS